MARSEHELPTELPDAVLPLAARGWRLLPCVERGKEPLLREWPRRASADSDALRKWAAKYPRCNWAVATGADSGIWVLDVDGDEGKASLGSLLDYADWTKTLTAKTGKGLHLYFQHPAGVVIRNSSKRIGPGLDVRGDGGYVLVPPSIHPSGSRYEWDAFEDVIALAPMRLFEKVATKASSKEEIEIIPEGQRNDRLTRIGGYLRRQGMDAAEIETKLRDHNSRRCRPPLPDAEVRAITVSVCRYAPGGGSDPLVEAWEAIQQTAYSSKQEQFVALARQLQRIRPDQSVVLPLERIAELMGCGWTSVRYYRKHAVLAGEMKKTADPIKHRRAAEYRVNVPSLPSLSLPIMPPSTHHGLMAISEQRSMMANPHDGKEQSPMMANDFCGYLGYFHDEVVRAVRHEGESDGEYKHAARGVQTRAEAEMAEGRRAVGQNSH